MAIKLPQLGGVGQDFRPPARYGTRGIKLEFGGAMSALEDAKQAVSNGPTAPTPDVSSGWEKLGQALSNVGEMGAELIQRNQELTDKRNLLKVENEWEIFRADMQTDLAKEPDPNKWLDVADERLKGFTTGVDRENMSPFAQQQLDMYLERQAKVTRASVATGSVVENERRLLSEFRVSEDNAVQSRNPSELGRLKKLQVDGGHKSESQALAELQGQSMQIRDLQRKDFDDNFKGLLDRGEIDKAGAMLKELAIPKPGIPLFKDEELADRTNMFEHATEVSIHTQKMGTMELNVYAEELADPKKSPWIKDQASRDQFARELYSLRQNKSAQTSMIAANDFAPVSENGNGTLRKPEDLSNPKYKDMLPNDRAFWNKALEKPGSVDADNWASLARDISSYTKTGDEIKDGLALAALEQKAQTIPAGPYRNTIVDMVNRKRNGSPAESDNEARSILDSAFSDGYAGVFKVPYEAATDPWFGTPKEGTALSPDDAAKAKAGIIQEGGSGKNPSIVEDQKLKAIAVENLKNAQAEIDRLKASGASSTAQAEAARRIVSKWRLAALPKSPPAGLQTYSVFPGAGAVTDKPSDQLELAKKILDSLK
jgi:hypothetical protein